MLRQPHSVLPRGAFHLVLQVTQDAWGIEDSYSDALKVWHKTTPETRGRLLAAMGVSEHDRSPPKSVELVEKGKSASLGSGELRLEDGTALRIDGPLPPDLPIGYHRFETDGRLIHVIVSPGRCHLPEGFRTWGWAVQLYSLRSRKSWGIGDLADLKALGRWSARLEAGMVLVNPLHATAPITPQESSPYYPSSRRFRNPLYLRIEDVPGFAEQRSVLEKIAREAHELNRQRLIDRDRVFRLKQKALAAIWSRFSGDARFDRFVQEQGEPLDLFATYCVLAEEYGGNWRRWPSEFRTAFGSGVARVKERNVERVRYHQWLQWLLDEQLRAAGGEVPVMQDLPIGADPNGADAWVWQDLLAEGISVGAPPDLFNTLGQNWGLPAFVPYRLQAAGYRPLIEVIRATLSHAGGLRIDHALGLFRLFWIPHGASAAEGAYVRYTAEEMLAIVAIESQRTKAIIVGEDLGTLEPGVRETLAQHRVLSYRVLWFEDVPSAEYPECALAAVTTHDLPTIPGLWTGADLAEQKRLNLAPNEEGAAEMRQRLLSLPGVQPDDEPEAVVEKSYRALAEAPSMVVAATLEDVTGVVERPNMPNTTWEQRPNWSMALPLPLEELEDLPLAHKVADALSRRQTDSSVRPSQPAHAKRA